MNYQAFLSAYRITMRFETGREDGIMHDVVMDRDDPGGMTYMGISRENHPNASIWGLVDDLRRRGELLSSCQELQAMVELFYIHEFWQRLQCDFFAERSWSVAAELFDSSVLHGHKPGKIFLQKALNLLNRNQSAYPDVEEDGAVGPATRKAFAGYMEKFPDTVLVQVMNHLQAEKIIQMMRSNPAREKWVGWFERTVTRVNL